MREILTHRFGSIRFTDEEVIEFPAALPGFEDEHQFLLLEPDASRPLVFLQSVGNPKLAFACAPVELVAPGYEAKLSRSDRDTLALKGGEGPPEGMEWLAILCFEKAESPTANLLGPVVVRRDARMGVQAVRDDMRYSARAPLFGAEGSCS